MRTTNFWHKSSKFISPWGEFINLFKALQMAWGAVYCKPQKYGSNSSNFAKKAEMAAVGKFN
jgi:hypothetical protein